MSAWPPSWPRARTSWSCPSSTTTASTARRSTQPSAPRGVTHLVLTGTMTDVCVLATAVGGMNREYRMTVVEDATATLWPEIQRASLDIIRRAYARVVSTKQLAEEIGRWSPSKAGL